MQKTHLSMGFFLSHNQPSMPLAKAIINPSINRTAFGYLTLSLLSPCALSGDWLQWSNSEIQYLHGGNFQMPGNSEDVSQSIITVTHADGWKYGRNFFFMDTLFTEDGQPSQTNLYGEAYSTFSLGKISGRDLSLSIFKDIGFTLGVNLGERMQSKQSGPRILLHGVTVDFNLPGFDYFNVDFLRHKIVEPVDIGGSWQITPVWKFRFQIADTKWSLEGFADFIGKKGDYQARQALAQPQLRLDVGDLWGHSNHLFVGIEYQYWHNKYGIKGLQDNVPQALLLWKF